MLSYHVTLPERTKREFKGGGKESKRNDATQGAGVRKNKQDQVRFY